MSSDSNQENSQQSGEAGDKAQSSDDKKPLSFKDWKNLKESQNKSQEKPQNAKNYNNNKSKDNKNNNNNSNNSNHNNGFNGSRGNFNCQGGGNFFNGDRRPPGFVPPNNNNFFGMNSFNNNFNRMNNNFNPNFGMGGNNNNSFRPTTSNSFNNSNGFGFNNFNGPNNNCNNNFNRPNNFVGNNISNNGISRLNPPPKIDLPDTFFASDGIYRQKDMMQKPLPDIFNPFKNEQKANELLKEFDRSRYTRDDKKKKKGKKAGGESKNTTNDAAGTNRNINNEPKVYVPNPKAKQDGKAYIPKPKIPEENLEISKEEKKQQWKEYRQAMKPFKNREFYNAKRVVQRLGKIPPSELEERQIIRLANAREVMANHKAHLTEKYANYEKANDSSNELGELYVLKKKPPPPPKDMSYKPTALENSGNFGESFGSGRKILGGYGGFPGFVSGGMLERPMP